MQEALGSIILRAALVALALLCAGALAFAPAEAPVCVAAAVGDGRLAIARPSVTGTAVAVYSVSATGVTLDHQFTVSDRLIGLAHKPGGSLALAWSPHAAYLLASDAPALCPLWKTGGLLLQLVEVAVPGHSSPLVIALSAEAFDAGQYRRSHLTLLDPSGQHPPRELSPESGYSFWAISVADVDGDGAEEIGLCTYSYTARDPRYARRFFVYGWGADGDLYPRWRGSRLCRPYRSAALMPVNGTQLVSREIGLGGGTLLVSYAWNQFGFWGLGHTEEYADVSPPQSADINGDGRAELVALVGDRAIAFANEGARWSPVAQSDPVARGSQILAVPDPTGARLCLIPSQADAAPSLLPLHTVSCTGGPP